MIEIMKIITNNIKNEIMAKEDEDCFKAIEVAEAEEKTQSEIINFTSQMFNNDNFVKKLKILQIEKDKIPQDISNCFDIIISKINKIINEGFKSEEEKIKFVNHLNNFVSLCQKYEKLTGEKILNQENIYLIRELNIKNLQLHYQDEIFHGCFKHIDPITKTNDEFFIGRIFHWKNFY